MAQIVPRSDPSLEEVRRDRRSSERMRREAELALLDRLRAEAAMPEWYPER